MKLKDEDIKEIARLIDEGWSYIKLACKFNMVKTNMNSLVRRYKMHGLEGNYIHIQNHLQLKKR